MDKSRWLGRCDNCGKEKSLTPGVDYQQLLTNAKTRWVYPVIDRKK